MKKSVNCIRSLAVDMINKANSGHPGIAMGASPMLYSLFKNHMNITSNHPDWINRDRFILSAGHGSSMLYALNHLLGFDVSMDDLKSFRQIGAKTVGHPELGKCGAEVTTGPLGQGIAMGVGMALASKRLASKFNIDGINIFDNYTYVLCGDGDLMEGISYEACSFAGKNQLDKLIVLYDSNNISLDGNVNLSFNENIKLRFEAQGWNYLRCEDGEDVGKISELITQAKASDKPTIIEIKTIIGHGCLDQGTNKVHGAPLSVENLAKAKEYYQTTGEFSVEDDVYDDFREIVDRGDNAYNNWLEEVNKLKAKDEDLYNLLTKMIDNKTNEISIESIKQDIATRVAGNICLENISKQDELMITGSADLSSSNQTNVLDNSKNIYYGVREFAMGAIANGYYLFAHNNVFVSTFLVFSDYLKPAMRLSSLMGLPINYVFTHDSVYVGEDGPTHQPVEQLAMFRSMPNVNVFRPCDDHETMAVYKIAYEQTNTPNVICLTRQPVNHITSDDVNEVYSNVAKGGYVIYQPQTFTKTIIATGSEVSLAIEIAKELGNIRVVSMPCIELFFNQDKDYINSIIGDKENNYVIEFASTYGWDRFVNNHDHIIGVDRFGTSGPASEVIKYLGLDKASIMEKINE